MATSDLVTTQQDSCDAEQGCPRHAQGVADELVRCSGVGKTQRAHLEEVLERWRPDHIYSFEKDDRLPPSTVYVFGPDGARLCDPSVQDPWNQAKLQAVLEAAANAADLLLRSPPQKVAFLCRAGKNRSRLLCSLACLFAKLKLQNSIDATTPVCAALRGLIQEISHAIDAAKATDTSVYQVALAAVDELTPFPPPASRRNSKRKR